MASEPTVVNNTQLCENVLNDPMFLREASISVGNQEVTLERVERVATRSCDNLYKKDTVKLYTLSEEETDDLVEALSTVTNENKTVEGMDGGYTVSAYTTVYYTVTHEGGDPGTVLFTQVTGGYTVKSQQVQVTAHNLQLVIQGENSNLNFEHVEDISVSSRTWTYVFPSSVKPIQNAELFWGGALYTVTIKRGTGSWNLEINNRVALPV